MSEEADVTEMLAELRTEVAALELRAGRRYYPDALRARLTSAAQALRGGGASWEQVAEQLDVGSSTLHGWCEQASKAHGPGAEDPRGALVPVELLAAADLDGGVPRGLVLTSPSGWRVEGLVVAEVAALLGALG